MHNAVIHDAESCEALLLRQQADPSLQSKDHARNTPLHLAAVHGDEVFASLLLAHGADPLSRNAYGSSPFTLASSGGVVSLCLEDSFDRIAALLQRHLSILVAFKHFKQSRSFSTWSHAQPVQVCGGEPGCWSGMAYAPPCAGPYDGVSACDVGRPTSHDGGWSQE